MLEVGIVLAVILAGVVARWILRRGSDSGDITPVRPMVPPSVSLSQELQDQLRATAIRGNPDVAIRELRKQTGMSALDASTVVHAILAGRVFPTGSDDAPTTMPAGESPSVARPRRRGPTQPIDAELLAMLRELVEQDPTHRSAAVMLLRQRTGMREGDAKRFVEAL